MQLRKLRAPVYPWMADGRHNRCSTGVSPVPSDQPWARRPWYEMSDTSIKPDWTPSRERIEHANVTALMRQLGVRVVPALHRWSNEHLEDFLRITVERLGVQFHTSPARMMDLSRGGVENPRWFPGASMNIAESCWGGESDAPAVVASGPGGKLKRWTYAELRAMSS